MFICCIFTVFTVYVGFLGILMIIVVRHFIGFAVMDFSSLKSAFGAFFKQFFEVLIMKAGPGPNNQIVLTKRLQRSYSTKT